LKQKAKIGCQGKCKSPGMIQASVIHLVLLALTLLCWSPLKVHAQDEGELLIQAPITEDFPEVSIRFKLQSPGTPPGSMLTLEQIRAYENEQKVKLLALDQERIGIHFTLALNGGSIFGFYDSNGVSNYEKIKSALSEWAQTRVSAPKDAWSFVVREGVIASHLPSIDEWVDSFEHYQTSFRSTEPDLSSLEEALNSARNRVVPFGVDKVLLYITPVPKPEQIGRINELAQGARQAGIRVNVWMVGDPYFLTNDQGKSLIELANLTGGQLFNYTGEEALPDPEVYLMSLGYLYQLTYQSEIRETGTFPFRMEVDLPDTTLTGESASFYLQISPPHPILISPPQEVARTYVSKGESGDGAWHPDLLRLNFMVEFPDHFEREIVASRLYVDGRLEDTRNEPPFDFLTWELADLLETGEYAVQVEVEDQLGLSDRTILIPIQIVVVEPEAPASISGEQIGKILAGGLCLVALIVLLIWGLRRFIAKRKEPESAPLKEEIEVNLPLREAKGTICKAQLIPQDLEFGQDRKGILLITQDGLAIGPDLLGGGDREVNAPNVDDTCAEIILKDGAFWLKDRASTRGTWVNYTQIGAEPVKLYTGDQIHFGDVGYRFKICDEDRPDAVTVETYEPLL
jgi:hypothetical protein